MGNVELDFSFYHPEMDIYSDGDSENEILDIVQARKVEEILERENRWPILYHLSPERKNILSWYPFDKEKSLLEIGCGCGAVTELFMQRVQDVEAIESSKRRAMITKERQSNQENHLLLHVGDFNRIAAHLTKKYDYVTMIGVLEYAPMFSPEADDPFLAMLKRCHQLLLVGGKLFLAIENRLGAKYFAGAGEDHLGVRYVGVEGYAPSEKVKTFSRLELQRLLMSAGFQAEYQTWYYPYPDYKFPANIFSDEWLPRPADLYATVEALDTERLAVFDEQRFLQSLLPGEFPIFSNSFLVIAEKEP